MTDLDDEHRDKDSSPRIAITFCNTLSLCVANVADTKSFRRKRNGRGKIWQSSFIIHDPATEGLKGQNFVFPGARI